MACTLFSPIDLRGVTVPNRITVAPMCQYSATNGVPGDWHLVHLGQFAQSGPGLIFVEATGVEPEGRITPGCTGLYDDATEAAFARIVAFMKSVGQSVIGIQLGHSGRKGSTVAPWEGGGLIEGPEGWQTDCPSAVPYLPGWPEPRAMDADAMARVKAAFVDATRRADRAGFDVIQLHVAHGYLLHQFLSPITNRRDDAYGGSSENRMRYPLEIFEAVRAAFPDDKPVLVRLSATDWIEGGWDVEQSVAFCQALKELGCDMVDVSSGGLDQSQQIIVGPGYQVGFAERIRREAQIPTMAVGQITDPVQAETILLSGQADMVALARGMLWDPRWTWKAAVALGAEIALPAPYARCNPKLRATPFVKRT
ncbi:NADH:flavin oxidoreductase/NADH oxidase [Jannaschia seohaensis]|uniref:NADPH2 dehydrogenase n=1 Tax=Jannaschia seohaensis TaxID=475081 RepID=A0A2Y9B218_9RHOB|nr:NADH:flavin oxidoreductase/NADH oxidase [Jannaschia seohaensis]PWJ17042.1 NADPH2 dehydrogenase [Jannaschia seohaensis]SSA48379.1 NADPH2 dehydrogenase [Jannaschia seohaensis]